MEVVQEWLSIGLGWVRTPSPTPQRTGQAGRTGRRSTCLRLLPNVRSWVRQKSATALAGGFWRSVQSALAIVADELMSKRVFQTTARHDGRKNAQVHEFRQPAETVRQPEPVSRAAPAELGHPLQVQVPHAVADEACAEPTAHRASRRSRRCSAGSGLLSPAPTQRSNPSHHIRTRPCRRAHGAAPERAPCHRTSGKLLRLRLPVRTTSLAETG